MLACIFKPGGAMTYRVLCGQLNPAQSHAIGHQGTKAIWFAFGEGLYTPMSCYIFDGMTPAPAFSFYVEKMGVELVVSQTQTHTLAAGYHALVHLTGRPGRAVPLSPRQLGWRRNWRALLPREEVTGPATEPTLIAPAFPSHAVRAPC